jgi:hypothetical protein
MVDYILKRGELETKIPVPTSWHDVTIEQWITLVNEDDGTMERRVAILTGIPISDIVQLSVNEFIRLCATLIFCQNIENLGEHNIVDAKWNDWYIGNESWEKLEKAKQELAKCSPQPVFKYDTEGNKILDAEGNAVLDYMTKAKDPINAVKEIVKIYTGEDVSGKPVTQVIGLANFFLSSYINFSTAIKN